MDVAENRYPSYVTVVAKIISYIFHPLFIPTYFFFWLLQRFPFEFAGISPMMLFARKITVFWMTAFFPAFAVFLLWRLKFIGNMYLRTQKERIVPYIITMIFYWWMWYLSRNFTDQPEVLRFFFLGMFFNTIIGLILNSFFKISMHGMAVGCLWTIVIITCFYYQLYPAVDVSVITIICGLVCSSRLVLKEHNNFDLYTGLFGGILCQLLALYFGS